MSVVIWADLEIKPEEVDWVIGLLQAVLPNTRKSDGCLEAELLRSQENPNNLIIYQVFETREHYQAYMGALQAADDPDGVMNRYFNAFTRPAAVRYYDQL